MKSNLIYKIAALAAPILLSACAVATIGNAPDQNPPKLVETNFQQGWDGSKLAKVAWDRPSAFGPVPADLQASGDAVCQNGGFERAIGYHPAALDVQAKPIPSGGYFCTGVKQKP